MSVTNHVVEVTNAGKDARDQLADYFTRKREAEKRFDVEDEAVSKKLIAGLLAQLSIGRTQFEYYQARQIEGEDVTELTPSEMLAMGFSKEFIDAVKIADSKANDPVEMMNGVSQTRASFVNCRAYLDRLCKLNHSPAFWGRNWANVVKAIEICAIAPQRAIRAFQSGLTGQSQIFWANLALAEVKRLNACIKQAIVFQGMELDPDLDTCRVWDQQENAPAPDGGWETWFMKTPAGQDYKERVEVEQLEDSGQWDWQE